MYLRDREQQRCDVLSPMMHSYKKMQPFEELGELLVPREQFTSDKYEQAAEKRSRTVGSPMVPMSGASPVFLVIWFLWLAGVFGFFRSSNQTD